VSDFSQSVLEDLNSTNGVFIKSRRVKRQELVDGDVIQLGEHKLLYRDMRGAAGPRLVVGDDSLEDEALDDESLDDDALEDAPLEEPARGGGAREDATSGSALDDGDEDDAEDDEQAEAEERASGR
jgi:hypothetical protein